MEQAFIEWTDEQLREYGVDRKRLERIVHRLELCVKDLKSMGLAVYSNSAGASIHSNKWHPQHDGDYDAVIVTVPGPFDGGDW